MRRPSPHNLLPLFGLVLAAGACRATGPPHAVETPDGIVRAESEALAASTARTLGELAPRIRALIPNTSTSPIEVWVERDWRKDGLTDTGYTVLYEDDAPCVHLREGHEELRSTFAHELVHAFLDEEWDTIPGLLEEGLCIWASEEVVERDHIDADVARLVHIGSYFDEVRVQLLWDAPGRDRPQEMEIVLGLRGEEEPVPPDNWLRLPGRGRFAAAVRPLGRERAARLYSLAYLLVLRLVQFLEVENVAELCSLARERGHETVPAEWILEAAQLHGREDWLEAAFALQTGEVLEHLLRDHPRFLALPLARVVHERILPRGTGLSLEELLERTRPRLRGAGGVELLLAPYPAFRRNLAGLRPDWHLPGH